MSSTNKTAHYELPQFVENDIFNPLVDDNDAFSKIDTALYNIANAESASADEITAVKNRVSTVEGKVTALETQNGDTPLTTSAQTISGAVNELKAGEDALDARLDVVEDDINNATTGLKVKVAANTQSITDEATTRANEDTALDNRITEEARLRAAEDDAINDSIANEATARANADSALGARIDTEATTRANGDSVLSAAISNEAGARQSADANLQTQIDALIAPSGEAPSAAEVENARIGVDRSYATLGQAIREQHRDTIEMLKDDGVYDLFSDYPFTSFGETNGVSATVTGQSTFTLNGTATADTNFNIVADSTQLIPNAKVDEFYHLVIDGELPTGVTFDVFRYTGGGWNSSSQYKQSTYTRLGISSLNTTGLLLRWHIANGTVINNVTVKLKLLTINPNNPVVYGSGYYDDGDQIEYCLNKFGKVILAKGRFLLQDAVSMPDNTRITGYGSASIVSPVLGYDAIIVGANCTVDNIAIEGYYTKADAVDYAGIKISKNYDTPPLVYETKLSNLKISKMGIGILGEKTGYWAGCSISADNIEITNCYRGLKLRKHSEFGRFTNINSHDNDIGVENCSGNNKFVNCSFSNNRINAYLDGWIPDGGDDGENNGHGCMVGCDFNHADNNTGISILVKWIEHNGFVFDGCNIWYGKVEVDEASTGIVISNSIFGGGTPTIHNYGNSDLFMFNNVFKAAPSVNNYGTLVEHDNYLFDGTQLTL